MFDIKRTLYIYSIIDANNNKETAPENSRLDQLRNCYQQERFFMENSQLVLNSIDAIKNKETAHENHQNQDQDQNGVAA